MTHVKRMLGIGPGATQGGGGEAVEATVRVEQLRELAKTCGYDYGTESSQTCWLAAELITRQAAEIEALRDRAHYAEGTAGLAMKHRDRAEGLLAEAVKMLGRYRTQTPLGHQPHMIAGEVDVLIAKIKSLLDVTQEQTDAK